MLRSPELPPVPPGRRGGVMQMLAAARRWALRFQPQLLGWSLVVLGFLLRLRLYAADLSLWRDEADVADNLVQRSLAGLTQPLDYNQAAPIGFMWIEKLSILALGNHDYIMRLFPLLAGLLSLILIYGIGRQHFGWAGLAAVLAVALSLPLIGYSATLKQYCSDVMIALLLIWLAMRCAGENVRARNFILLGLAGLAGIWMSHPAIFVLAAVGIALLADQWMRRQRAGLLWTLSLGGLWVACFGIEYLVALRALNADAYLNNYWFRGFMILPPWSRPQWFVNTYLNWLDTDFQGLDRRYLEVSWFVLLMIGAVSLFWRNKILALMFTLPFVLALTASALQKYPVRGRLILFLAPFLALLFAEGLGRIQTVLAARSRVLAWSVYGALLFGLVIWPQFPSVHSGFIQPARPEDIRPVMAYMGQHWQSTDVIYLSGGIQAFHYYAPAFGLVTEHEILRDYRDSSNYAQFTADIDSLAGNERVWILFPIYTDAQTAAYVRYLDQAGRRLDQAQSAGARAYLYDLKR